MGINKENGKNQKRMEKNCPQLKGKKKEEIMDYKTIYVNRPPSNQIKKNRFSTSYS